MVEEIGERDSLAIPADQEEELQPLKLFVGQVPKDMTEEDLKPIFEAAGPVAHVMVIRDRATKSHRGCAFLTYETRQAGDIAIEMFHNKVKLQSAQNPLQIRPADSQAAERENKLFVGMISPAADEDVLHQLFSPYGEIVEVYVMRNHDGKPKGCAFVKYIERSFALAAIEALNEKVTMEGAARPLVVKFADVRKINPQRAPQWGVSAGPGVGVGAGVTAGIHASYWAGYKPVGGAPGQGGGGQFQQPYYAPGYTHPIMPSYASAYGSPVQPSFLHYQYPMQGGGGGGGGIRGPPVGSTSSSPEHESTSSRPLEGPFGANLFVYHLPHDITDADLATAFTPFGNVISAKVFIDKRTGESKGFGFVSFDSPPAAEEAIKNMNGFQIGAKRLKVQHKRVNNFPPGVNPAGMQMGSMGHTMNPMTPPTGPMGGYPGSPMEPPDMSNLHIS